MKSVALFLSLYITPLKSWMEIVSQRHCFAVTITTWVFYIKLWTKLMHMVNNMLTTRTSEVIQIRLVVIFQEAARNHFWEAGILKQSYMLNIVQ